MNITAVFYKPSGEITLVRTGSEGGVQVQLEHSKDEGFVVSDAKQLALLTTDKENAYVDVNSKTIVTRPPRPGADYDFDYDTKDWVRNQSKYNELAMAKIRSRRTELLFQSDWTQVADVPLTPEQKQAWQVYRQQLRDITDEYADATDINTVQWPTPPSV
jgi:hypothetical protein